MKDSLRLKKIEERDRQVLVEKIMHSIEYSNPYQNPTEKKKQIIKTVESKYKISRRVYQATNSHGLVSLQFLYTLEIFFGVDKSIPKSAITELYKNLSYETWSGARDFDFQAVSGLISEVFR